MIGRKLTMLLPPPKGSGFPQTEQKGVIYENPLMKSIRKKNGKCLYKSQLDDDEIRYEKLRWVETRRCKEGGFLSWEEVFDEE